MLQTVYWKSPVETFTLEFIEVCTPFDSPLTETVMSRGGSAERWGLWNFDLGTERGYLMAPKKLSHLRPRHLWLSSPCTMSSPMQNATPWWKLTKPAQEERKRRYKNASQIWNSCISLALQQTEQGGHAHAGKNPLRASDW